MTEDLVTQGKNLRTGPRSTGCTMQQLSPSSKGPLWLSVRRELLRGGGFSMEASVPRWAGGDGSTGSRRKDVEAPLGLRRPSRKLVVRQPRLGG